jgi:Arc/MetJ-type ribon-helix-helix transcriptional regulator
MPMNSSTVTLTLNQQQRELLDRTVAQGLAPDRESLVRLALREYAAWRDADADLAEPATDGATSGPGQAA